MWTTILWIAIAVVIGYAFLRMLSHGSRAGGHGGCCGGHGDHHHAESDTGDRRTTAHQHRSS